MNFYSDIGVQMALALLKEDENIEYLLYLQKREKQTLGMVPQGPIDLSKVVSLTTPKIVKKNFLLISLYDILNNMKQTNKSRKYINDFKPRGGNNDILNSANSLRIEMEQIVRNFRLDNGKMIYMQFIQNLRYGEFSICLSIYENDNKHKLYSEAYAK
jgi:hypothetical protein